MSKYRTFTGILGVVVQLSFFSHSVLAQDSANQEDAARQIIQQMTPAEKFSQLVNQSIAVKRLNIQAYNYWTESLHGLNSENYTTNFPQPIGLAATFDDQLLKKVAAGVRHEIRANYKLEQTLPYGDQPCIGLDVWSPNINIFRDPRWGRGHETYGEDPFLTGRMAVAYIQGLQGPDPDHPLVIATPKHFAVHSGPEATRHSADVQVSSHDLEDTYLPAFRAAVVEGKAGSVMCAYNSIQGVPACANSYLLTTKLRGDWGFKGYVVSDCGAVDDIYQQHAYRPDAASAVGAAIKAGMDNECGNTATPAVLQQAINRGDISSADVDRALLHEFTARIALETLSGTVSKLPAAKIPPSIGSELSVVDPANAALALQTAAESVVLLKNDGILPLRDRKLTIAVVGPLADAVRVMRGNYSNFRQSSQLSILQALRGEYPKAQIKFVLPGQFYGEGDPIPTNSLRTPDGKAGLKAEYYAVSPNTIGAPLAFPSLQPTAPRVVIAKDARLLGAGVTPSVNFVTTFLDGVRGLPDKFDVVWTGFLVPKESGHYRLGLKGTAGQVELDGKELKPDSVGAGRMATVNLEKGHRYHLRVISSKRGPMITQLVWNKVSLAPEDDARALAQSADVVVAVVGLTAELEGEETLVSPPGFNHGDRTTLDLPQDEQKLLEAIKTAGKPLVVVALNGGAVNLTWEKENANAIIEAWYPGQAGGPAIADVLLGKYNPAGRLPITFYADVAQLPPFDDYDMRERTYRYFMGTPVYPFGYGLSYTQFRYSDLKLDYSNGELHASAKVSNVGPTAGDEVTQLYLNFPDVPGVPNIALRGFSRISLNTGETKTVQFVLSPRDLSAVTEDGKRSVLPGNYTVTVGGGQPNGDLPFIQGNFSVAALQSVAP